MERTAADNREFVLCFDGTGYKFRGDESDSNVLKIYRVSSQNKSQFRQATLTLIEDAESPRPSSISLLSAGVWDAHHLDLASQ